MFTKTDPRIAFYCSSTSWGGLEMNTIRYALWMQESGFNVSVFCVVDTPLHSFAKENALNIVLVKRNRKYADLLNAWRVHRLFQKNKIQWVWFRDTRDMDLLFWVKLLGRNRIKVLYQQAMQLGVDKKDVLHTLRFKAIDVWISTLSFLKSQVVSRTHFPEHKIHVVPLGTDASVLDTARKTKNDACAALGLDASKFIIGIIGRIDPLKGQHTVINALQLLKDESMHLIIVGESTKNEGNHYEVELKQKVRSLGLQHAVSFFPYSKNVALFYSAMDVFVMASKGETFGTVTIEAMAMGVPVIGTNTSGTPELLDHGKSGLLFTPENADELSQHLENIAKDKLLRESLIQTARERFEKNYSKRASVGALEAIIRQYS